MFLVSALVAESCSMGLQHSSVSTVLPADIRITRSALFGKVNHSSLLQHQQQQPAVLAVRGGSSLSEDDAIDVIDPPPAQANDKSRVVAAWDATDLTAALVAFGQMYSKSMETWPIGTKSFTAGVLFAISDQMAQSLEIRRARNKGNDKSTAPILACTNKIRSMWYAWIFQTFPGKSMLSILQKASLGQFFFAPPLFCVFFAAALVQNGQFTLSNWGKKIRQDLAKGWIGGLGFWPIINYISYGYVPPKYIPLFINCMGLIFNIYVSLIANRKQ